MSSAPQYRPHYTIKDYGYWEGDWELWHGTAVAMSPSPFGIHAALLIKVGKILDNAIEASGCLATVLAEIDWIVSEDTIVRPDLTIVCGGPPPRHVEDTPAIVVEILSDGTRDRDLVHKKNLFQANMVPWYLIVDPANQSTTVWQLDSNGQYAEAPSDDSLNLTICNECRLSVDLSKLF